PFREFQVLKACTVEWGMSTHRNTHFLTRNFDRRSINRFYAGVPPATRDPEMFGFQIPFYREREVGPCHFGLSCTIRPPTIVMSELILALFASAAVSGSAFNIARSANLPGSSEPFLFSSKVRYAP